MDIARVENKLQNGIIWFAAIACLLAGISVALDHTFMILAPHNYWFALMGDDALDGVPLLYPVLLGQKSFFSIFQPYADHRLVIERLLAMYDFHFSHGTQSGNPFRVVSMLWLGYFLYIASAIYPNKTLDKPSKLLLSGVYLALIFACTTVLNYGSTSMNTWPITLVFSLSAFIMTSKYCEMANTETSKIKLISYICATFIFVMLAMYTFGVSLILWPIIFIVLYKNNCLKKHWQWWLGAAVLSYILFTYDGWHAAATQLGIKTFLHGHPVEMFLYLSRLFSIPLIINAPTTVSITTITLALAIFALSILCIIAFWKKQQWSRTDNIIFAYLMYGLLTSIAMAMTRFWMEFEVISVGLRFAIASFILMMGILTSCFIFLDKFSEGQLIAKTGLVILSFVWLIAWFIPMDKLNGMFDQSYSNQFFILETTGIPIDDGFVEEIKKIENEQDPKALNFLNDTQKKYHKGAYSFWPAQYLNQFLDKSYFRELEPVLNEVKIEPTTDFRIHQNPGLFINVKIEHPPEFLSKNWEILFTNSQNKVVGFALISPNFIPNQPAVEYTFKNIFKQPVKFNIDIPYFKSREVQMVWQKITRYQLVCPCLAWSGAVNTALLSKDDKVIVWAVDNKEKKMCKLGEITV